MQRSGRSSDSRARRPVRALGVMTGAAAVLVLGGCGQDAPLTTPNGSPISTTTTRIAEVNLVSPERDYSKTCLAPTDADAGQTDVEHIVVTDPTLLDAVCALGIGSKVSAVASAPGSIPAYLGPQLTAVPTIGAEPDAAAVRKADAGIVLTTPQTAGAAKAFDGARVVTISSDSADPAIGWRQRFQSVADALGRSASGTRLLDEFETEAAATGRRMDAAHNQVSLIRFGDNSEQVAGTDSFAGQILALIGVQRPAAQRSPQSFAITDQNFTDADADLIYVSFEGERGLAHGKQVLLSDRWLDMGAPTWKRVLGVDDDVWYRSSGLAAAWLVLNDVKNSLDGSSANY